MRKFLCALFILAITPVFAGDNNAIVPVPKLEDDFYDWYERHDTIKDYVKKNPAQLIFIGDSITHMFGGTPESEKPIGHEVWEKYYSHRKAVNMGFGWDRTQNVLWRLNNVGFESLTPKVVVLLIGTNNLSGTENALSNSPKQIFEGIEQVCETIHRLSPTTHIIALALLPRSPTTFVEPIRANNSQLKELEQKDYVTVVDMTAQFADENGLPRQVLMLDTVHPNLKGYEAWAKTIEPTLSQLLGDKPVLP